MIKKEREFLPLRRRRVLYCSWESSVLRWIKAIPRRKLDEDLRSCYIRINLQCNQNNHQLYLEQIEIAISHLQTK